MSVAGQIGRLEAEHSRRKSRVCFVFHGLIRAQETSETVAVRLKDLEDQEHGVGENFPPNFSATGACGWFRRPDPGLPAYGQA